MISDDELVMFLRARLGEDEAVAREAAGLTEHWVAEGPAIGVVLVDGEPLIEGHITGLTAHIARHDPARALREVAAKRRLLELAWDADQTDRILDEEIARKVSPGELTTGGLMIRAMAAVYSNHPDYQQEWKP